MEKDEGKVRGKSTGTGAAGIDPKVQEGKEKFFKLFQTTL